MYSLSQVIAFYTAIQNEKRKDLMAIIEAIGGSVKDGR